MEHACGSYGPLHLPGLLFARKAEYCNGKTRIKKKPNYASNNRIGNASVVVGASEVDHNQTPASSNTVGRLPASRPARIAAFISLMGSPILADVKFRQQRLKRKLRR